MENFIVIMKDSEVLHGAGYTAMLRRKEDEGLVDKIIDISNPTEPKMYDKKYGRWFELCKVT